MRTRFHSLSVDRSPVVFTQLEAITPKTGQPGFYPGVLIIQKGPAKGHFAIKEEDGRVVNCDWDNPEHLAAKKYPIMMGDDMLNDVVRCGTENENTKAKLDHGETVRDIVGGYSNFSRDGDQVRADLTLMDSSIHREYVEELFAKFAKKVGNSIDFNYRYEIQGEVAVARCNKLNSVDIVDAPAATNSLFNENPNTPPPQHMPLSKEDLDAIGNALESRFSKLETGIKTRLGEIETRLEKGPWNEPPDGKKMEEGDDDKDKKKDKKDDDDKKDAMSEGKIEKAVLSAVRQIFPKAVVENLASLGQGNGAAKDEYAEKVALCEAAGLKGTQVVRHIAAKFPEIYNAKFGDGGGQKGGASTKL